MKTLSTATLVVIITCAGLTVGIWSFLNQPVMEPVWPQTLQGISFSPYRSDQDAVEEIYPDVEQINDDLELLSGKTHAIRIYTTEAVFYEIPKLAIKHNLNITVGAWIDKRIDHNEAEIKRAIELAQYRNVVRLIIGNEVLLRKDVSVNTLIEYLDVVRETTGRPVSTAETWSTWLKYPELAGHVDFIAIHILPYWEGIDVRHAVDFVKDKVELLKNQFPDKPIVLAEVGWPSEGRTRYDAVATASNEALFLRRFLNLAEQEDYVYYLMEAFDQPWKRRLEGEVGAYWGIYNVDREPKFPFHEPIVRIPEWPLLASISVTFGIILLSLLFITNHTVNTEGKTFLAIIVYGLVTLVSLLIYDYTNQYLTISGMIVGIIMLIFMTVIITLLLSEAHEWIEAYWISHRRRTYKIEPSRHVRFPMVSIHVPIYNEPPEMVIETLNALSRLDYPNFEVCVVDNNTSDENIWRPVENHCLILGQRFNFYHVNPLAGFKAGALNYALQHTSDDAEILAYIDSDYIVDPSWLKDLVPAFNNKKISIVQAPQDYRDADQSVFKAMCYAEYCGFFHIGMVTRNDRNAIIQHGTMTMVRRSTMEKLGGWAEWCITEDAELGLRVFEQGLEACYIPRSYGKGLIPDTFIDYKKQRFRWAYGAVQILKNHTRKLFLLGESQLSAGQRYHFIAGWLPWFAEGLNLLFVIFAILWSVAMIYYPEAIDSPSLVFSLLPVMFFVFKLLKLVHLYRKRIGASVPQIIAALVAGLSLSHTIGLAMIHGLFTKNQPFIRTPKQAKVHEFYTVIASAKEEILILIALWLSIFTLATTKVIVSPDYKLWLLLLSVQSLPYAATVITSLISAFPVRTNVLEKDIQKTKVLIAQSGE